MEGDTTATGAEAQSKRGRGGAAAGALATAGADAEATAVGGGGATAETEASTDTRGRERDIENTAVSRDTGAAEVPEATAVAMTAAPLLHVTSASVAVLWGESSALDAHGAAVPWAGDRAPVARLSRPANDRPSSLPLPGQEGEGRRQEEWGEEWEEEWAEVGPWEDPWEAEVGPWEAEVGPWEVG